VKSNRILEIDILRVIAILVIVVCHIFPVIPSLTNNNIVSDIEYWLSNIGTGALSLFFLLSGYSLMIRKPQFDTISDLKSFFVKRIVRIYPLYWVSLLIWAIIPYWGYIDYPRLTPFQQLLNIMGFGFQELWFVGAILLFYLLFPILIFFANKLGGSFQYSILVVALIISIILLSIFLILPSIRAIISMIFVYYWFFVLGIILGRGTSISRIKSFTIGKVIFLSGIGLVFIYVIRRMSIPFLDPVEQLIPDWIQGQIVRGLFGIIGISIAIQLTNSTKGYFIGPLYRIVRRVGPRTYSIFLFHPYILLAIAVLANALDSSLVPVLVIIIGIPLSIFIPPYIQDAVDYGMSRFANRLHQLRGVEKEGV